MVAFRKLDSGCDMIAFKESIWSLWGALWLVERGHMAASWLAGLGLLRPSPANQLAAMWPPLTNHRASHSDHILMSYEYYKNHDIYKCWTNLIRIMKCWYINYVKDEINNNYLYILFTLDLYILFTLERYFSMHTFQTSENIIHLKSNFNMKIIDIIQNSNFFKQLKKQLLKLVIYYSQLLIWMHGVLSNLNLSSWWKFLYLPDWNNQIVSCPKLLSVPHFRLRTWDSHICWSSFSVYPCS